ncbi:mycofactocin-coupled SDR family oxidoreductase [Streptomyces sp. NPDC051985]|uniref:mycofactocin-coupled SDR family oxidoreductase n=1 Tax=Streptomyces sp. NPDC051985 TaxID=3155807 RepID=UPI003415F151
MSDALAQKVVLVTGAARGQGRSHAVRLAGEGADIIALDICAQIDTASYTMPTEEDLEETARLVREQGRRVVACVADVRERRELSAAVDAGVRELGRLDVVVANAGITTLGPDVPVQGWFDTVAVNLVGVINTVEASYPHLGPGSSIVCIGSMAALLAGSVDTAGPGGAGYAHAKRHVARLVHDLALQLAPASIRVNAIHPGNVDTTMIHHDALYRLFRPDLESPVWEDVAPGVRAVHKLPVTTIAPSDISEAVLFLASDMSRYVTGQQLKVDAGALLPTTGSGAPS